VTWSRASDFCLTEVFCLFQDQTVSNLSQEIAVSLGLRNRKAYISSQVSTHNPLQDMFLNVMFQCNKEMFHEDNHIY